MGTTQFETFCEYVNTIPIVYPPGAHGQFLSMLLNRLSGVPSETTEDVYDRTQYHAPRRFGGIHFPDNRSGPSGITISVSAVDIPKYFLICLHRTCGLGHNVNQYNQDTFKKINEHPMLVGFQQDLERISGQTSGDVATRYIREWFRLCFLDNDYRSIRTWLNQCYNPQADFEVDFSTFYNLTALIDVCKRIMYHYNLLDASWDIVPPLHARFLENNTDQHYGEDFPEILSALTQLHDKNIQGIDVLAQARIDHYLASTHNIDPLLRDEYFGTLAELYQAYGLTQ